MNSTKDPFINSILRNQMMYFKL